MPVSSYGKGCGLKIYCSKPKPLNVTDTGFVTVKPYRVSTYLQLINNLDYKLFIRLLQAQLLFIFYTLVLAYILYVIVYAIFLLKVYLKTPHIICKQKDFHVNCGF